MSIWKLSDELVGKIEEADFSISYDEKDKSIYFSRYSTAGQDFGFYVDCGESLSDLAENILMYHENYDVDEEAALWIGEDGHGKNGAPYSIREIIEDMEECEGFIYELYMIISNNINPEAVERAGEWIEDLTCNFSNIERESTEGTVIVIYDCDEWKSVSSMRLLMISDTEHLEENLKRIKAYKDYSIEEMQIYLHLEAVKINDLN